MKIKIQGHLKFSTIGTKLACTSPVEKSICVLQHFSSIVVKVA